MREMEEGEGDEGQSVNAPVSLTASQASLRVAEGMEIIHAI